MQAVASESYRKETNTVENLIHNCTQMIQRNAIIAGMGNRMIAPVLSILLGKRSVACRSQIEDSYFSFWSSQAKNLRFLEGAYDRDAIENAIADAAGDKNYAGRRKLRAAWYWDITDDDFDTYFQCVSQDISAPLGYEFFRTFFIFCSQRTTIAKEKTQQRLTKLIAWAKEHNYQLIVLSDVTKVGLLTEQEISENYHLAATILQLLNSEGSNDLDADRIATRLQFQISNSKAPVWTASYAVCCKQFFDIISVSIGQILHKYLQIANSTKSKDSFQNDSSSQDIYLSMLDDLFQSLIVPHGPKEQSLGFWADLPYTADIADLDRALVEGPDRPKRGILGALFGRKNSGEWRNAIDSVLPFWTATVNYYYANPMTAWLESSEGQAAVSEYMYAHLANRLSLNDMKHTLKDEAEKLKRSYENFSVNMPEPMVGQTVQEYLHSCACAQIKQQFIPQLFLQLAHVMEKLHQHASNFEPLLRAVSDSLLQRGADENVRRAYAGHMDYLLSQHPEILHGKIHPCETEAELLMQLENTFQALVEMDASRKYYASLQEDIQFQIAAGAAAYANNIIDNCFSFDMLRAGRLLSYQQNEGTLYCIMNNTLTQLLGNIDANHIGEKFIANRSDRIERVYLYTIDPDWIQYQ